MRFQSRQKQPTRIEFEDVLASTVTDKRVDVLRAIKRAGSISEAARMTGVSYKAAWQAVDALSNLAGVPLIEKGLKVSNVERPASRKRPPFGAFGLT